MLDAVLVGDVDADGVRDVGLVERWFQTGPQRLRILSGRDGREIWRALNVRSGTDSGWLRVADAGDVDGDGRDDVLTGDPKSRFRSVSGSVSVLSGADGSTLRTLTPPGGGTEPTFGLAVAGAGDLDGDGTPDVAISSTPRGQLGSVTVVSGRTWAVIRSIDGANLGSGVSIGYALAAAGDVDGDGLVDLVTSSPGGRREVVALSGRDGSMLLRIPAPQVFPDTAFGYALAGVGDMDGDGLSDFAVGDPFVDDGGAFQYRGAAYVYGMGPGGAPDLKLELRGVADQQYLGGSVAGLGDVDGDGVPDLAASSGLFASAPGAYMHSFVVSGVPQGPSNRATVLFTVPNQAGSTIVLGPGDVDGDGLGELLWAGTGSEPSELRYYGTTPVQSVWTATHPDPDREVGVAVDRVGDVNGDGVEDLAVSARSVRSGVTDRVLLVDGTNGSILRVLDELAPGTEFGAAVAGLPDADGDGCGDVAVGAPLEDGNGVDSGAVHVFSGATGSVLFSRFGDSAGDEFGRAVCSAGDFDADGFSDVAASASVATIRGYLRVFRGRDGRPLHRVSGSALGTGFGAALAGGVDVDDDGFGDLLLSEPGWQQGGLGPGRVVAVSGRTRQLLQQVTGASSGPLAGFVGGAGDVDGDLRDDFVVSGPRARIERGGGGAVVGAFGATFAPVVDAARGDFDGDGLSDVAAIVEGGADVVGWSMGSRLAFQSVPPTAADSFRGGRLAGVGDVDGDGFDEIALARAADDRLWVLRPAAAGRPATGRSFGLGCPGSNGALPRIAARSRAFLGGRLRLDLRGAPGGSAVTLNLGPRLQIDLAFVGLPGCTLLVSPDLASLDATTSAFGVASLGADVPRDTVLLGAAFSAQWVCLDPAANAGGATLSDGAALVIGTH